MSAGGHAGRDHAKLSASGAHRWLVCTPSAALEAQFPDTGSAAAALSGVRKPARSITFSLSKK